MVGEMVGMGARVYVRLASVYVSLSLAALSRVSLYTSPCIPLSRLTFERPVREAEWKTERTATRPRDTSRRSRCGAWAGLTRHVVRGVAAVVLFLPSSLSTLRGQAHFFQFRSSRRTRRTNTPSHHHSDHLKSHRSSPAASTTRRCVSNLQNSFIRSSPLDSIWRHWHRRAARAAWRA